MSVTRSGLSGIGWLVLKAYFDESSDQHQEKIFVVGGMCGLYEEWAKIEWRWKALLEKYSIQYYRASEAEFARGQFDREPYRTDEVPTSAERHVLLKQIRDEFFEVLTSGTVSGLAIGIPIRIFQEVADTPERLEKFGGTPYYLCGHTAILRLLKAQREVLRSKDLITFMFDTQKEFGREMLKVHAHIQSKACEFHAQAGSITFDDKKTFIPLQVADTLAYESRKYLERKLDDSNALPRPELQRLMDTGKIFEISLCEKTCLEFYLNN